MTVVFKVGNDEEYEPLNGAVTRQGTDACVPKNSVIECYSTF